MIHPQSSILAAVVLASLFSCDGGGASTRATPTGGAILKSVEYGRLVDIYAYQRIDATREDRRDTANRRPMLIERDVLIRPDVETQALFDTFGNARLDSDYRFMPFDVAVGHPKLLILWDNTIPPEQSSFDTAVARATRNLPRVPDSFRSQNTSKRPIPMVPRNAAIRLRFDRELNVASAFFQANPSAIQLLEFIAPRGGTGTAFRPIPARILPGGDSLILDTSLIGGESQNGRHTDGLPPSLDTVTANIRIALPTVGVLSKLIDFAEDPVAELNGSDANGDRAVIRDFRSGNVKDGPAAGLTDLEAPMLVAHLKMGITAVDSAQRILTINKRGQNVPIRGRIPYVDGALDPSTGLATGPISMPLALPLRSGDIIMQTVVSASGERLQLRAEVVMNMDVGNIIGDANFKGLGMNRVGTDPGLAVDGGDAALVRVKVTKLVTTDASGTVISFRGNALPLGEDITVRVHYYHNVPYRSSQTPGPLTAVSDAARKRLFLGIDPEPPRLSGGRTVELGTLVDPNAAIAMRFSEPIELRSLDPFENFMLTNWTIGAKHIDQLIDQAKPLGLALLPAKLVDRTGDATLLQLRPPLGHFHAAGIAETYWCHLILGKRAPRDLAGNFIDIYDRTASPAQSLSFDYELHPDAAPNHVGYRAFRFVRQDEDGTAIGSADAFGQFQLFGGAVRALPVSRFSAVADSQVLSGITRFDRGECDIPGTSPPPPGTPTPAAILGRPGLPGLRFSCPSMFIASVAAPLSFQPPGAQPGGGISEPHNQRGSRLQMSYLEDDFGFAYHDATKILLDIEQMHWAPFNDSAIRFDVFDRYTMRMAHCDWRPDMTFIVTSAGCLADCYAGRGGLRPVFDDNVLIGSRYEVVVKDKVYEINPNDAFRAPTGTKFVPYPQFTKTYTWRDPRLATWDTRRDEAVGFGGAHQPTAPAAIRDTTSSASSPYVPDLIENTPPLRLFRDLHQNTEFVFDYGDFAGYRTRDHSPIALPLLIDFSVFPDGPDNGGFALGSNQFHIALLGPCSLGYYNNSPMCAPLGIPAAQVFGFTIPFPESRAHASGGIDQVTGADILISPEVTAIAQGSVIKDIIMGDAVKGLWKAPGVDDHVHWAQADFVRRVSMVTYGFWNTLQPNAHDFDNPRSPLPPEVIWDGRSATAGIPDLANLGAGVQDLVTIMDPPLSEQAIGTRVVVEWRGAQTFDNDDKIFSQSDDTDPTVNWTNLQLVKQRGNLLNPFYAGEAYRYASANPMTDQTSATSVYQPSHTLGFPAGARVDATGLTPYVTEDRLDTIRRPNGLLPQLLNFRIIMENNMTANPPISPSIRSFAVAYRIGVDQ